MLSTGYVKLGVYNCVRPAMHKKHLRERNKFFSNSDNNKYEREVK